MVTAPNLPTSGIVPEVTTGHAGFHHKVHKISNYFDLDAVYAAGQVPVWDATAGLLVPGTPASGLDTEGVRDAVAVFVQSATNSRITISHDDPGDDLFIGIDKTALAVDLLIITGKIWTVKWTGSAWPALSTVPAAWIATGLGIEWDSSDDIAAPEPPEARNNLDHWLKKVA